jgi:hypothetical protein
MTDQQNNLLAYVESRINAVIEDKRSRRVSPDCAALNEILANAHNDAIECMRELIRSGRYRGAISINYPIIFQQ